MFTLTVQVRHCSHVNIDDFNLFYFPNRHDSPLKNQCYRTNLTSMYNLEILFQVDSKMMAIKTFLVASAESVSLLIRYILCIVAYSAILTVHQNANRMSTDTTIPLKAASSKSSLCCGKHCDVGFQGHWKLMNSGQATIHLKIKNL